MAEAYGDIKAAYGDNILAIANHYVTVGITENRTIGTANGYADIATAQKAGAVVSASRASRQMPGNVAPAAGPSVNNGTNYQHVTTIYHDDGETLWRKEYYDENNKIAEYSSITDVDNSTNSYTENVYKWDDEKNEQVLQRTDKYENGELVSSERP